MNANKPEKDSKAISILARTLFKDMREQGFSPDQIIGLSSQLIDLVHEDLQKSIAYTEIRAAQ